MRINLVRTDGVATLSAADPITTVTAMSHPGLVDSVLVAGRILKRHGRLTGPDVGAERAVLGASRGGLIAAAYEVDSSDQQSA